MIAACARVGANAPNGGMAGSLAGSVRGSRGAVKSVLIECRIFVAEFDRALQRRTISIAPKEAGFASGYVWGFIRRRWAQTLPVRPRVIDGAPVPFESSALNCVTVPSGEVTTVILQNRGSSDIEPGVRPSP